jgi:enoyl-CoA hydratase/carnithine racemase
MSDTPVTFDVTDGVARITLNRPRVLNALDTELAATLADHAERAAGDGRVTVVVLRGAGRAFCSGMDRTALAGGTIAETFYRHWIRALNCLEDMPKVTLAVLHGYSIGGGLQLALGCDLRVSTSDAVLGLGATRHGILPDGSILRLARVIGLGRAKELTLLNEHITPDEAKQMGLVNFVCPPGELETTIEGVVEKARAGAPTANAHAKRLLQASFHEDPRAMIEDVLAAQLACMTSWEVEEANRAWHERREAVFHPLPPGREAPRAGHPPR